MPTISNSFRTGPDERGHFGIFGGRYVETLMLPLILDLREGVCRSQDRPAVPG